jgi:hypothetical protein
MTNQSVVPGVITPDDEARIADFFSRHGGPGLIQQREGNTELHTRGWWEVYAADGHKLRCEWSKAGTKTQMNFSEITP